MPTPPPRRPRSTDLEPTAYRPFNLIVADHRDAYWLRHAGALPSFAYRTRHGDMRMVEPIQLPGAELPQRAAGAGIDCRPIPDGLSMLTARELNDPASERIRRTTSNAFATPRMPDPERADWDAWVRLLGDRAGADGDPRNAMAIVTGGDYGTVCSSLVALPAAGPPRMWFASGLPGEAPFEAIAR